MRVRSSRFGLGTTIDNSSDSEMVEVRFDHSGTFNVYRNSLTILSEQDTDPDEPFNNSEIGDRVISTRFGEGIITAARNGFVYPITVRFKKGRSEKYSAVGSESEEDKTRTLFFLDSDNNKCDLRPAKVPTVASFMIPKDTRVFGYHNDSWEAIPLYYAGKDLCFKFGRTSWSSNGETDRYEKIVLAEEIIIDGVVCPVGTIVVPRTHISEVAHITKLAKHHFS